MDVHSRSTVWCLLDASGEIAAEGKVETRPKELAVLVRELSVGQELVVGQEVGTMAYLVHDALVAAGTKILSFNAAQLRMIASSRKKTDRRDAYWIGRALASGMYPQPARDRGADLLTKLCGFRSPRPPWKTPVSYRQSGIPPRYKVASSIPAGGSLEAQLFWALTQIDLDDRHSVTRDCVPMVCQVLGPPSCAASLQIRSRLWAS